MANLPWKCPGDGLGASPGTSGTSRRGLRAIPHRLDRMSAGQTGHSNGANRTRPPNGCGPEVCGFFLSIKSWAVRYGRCERRTIVLSTGRWANNAQPPGAVLPPAGSTYNDSVARITVGGRQTFVTGKSLDSPETKNHVSPNVEKMSKMSGNVEKNGP